MRKITETEKMAGQTADFIVYYVRNGKTYRDAMWAPNAEECEHTFLAFCKELRWKVQVLIVLPTIEHIARN
jgi:hypothetical protein